jgi:ketosteroid isomerase-like protein
MADLAPVIETLEHRWMRAWVSRDAKAMKAITARGFILLTGSKPPAILDRPSWLDAATERYLCSSYRFGDIDVRSHGNVAIFAAEVELKATMDGHDWSGSLWVTDVWRKKRIGGWKLVQRVLSRGDGNPQLPAAIRSLQLWK